MTRLRMMLIVVLMCTAIVAVVILQGSWLLNSYAVSKEKNEAEVKDLLELAITEQKRQMADTVRNLMRQIIRSDKDFGYRILDWPTETKIGFNSKNENTYAVYDANDQDTLFLRKNPYGFFVKKLSSLTLDEIHPLYSALVGGNEYDSTTAKRAIQLKLSSSFTPFQDTAALKHILQKVFLNDGRSFNGTVRFFKDISNVYSKPPVTKPIKKNSSNSFSGTIGVLFGSDNTGSLAVKLDLLAACTDSLNALGDSTFVAKPLLYDINDILRSTVPTILVSVHTPYTLIGKTMSAGIFGSFALMIFIMLSLTYMYSIIVKQKQLSEIKNDFISNISHELNTPIATAQAAVQGLSFFNLAHNPEKTEAYLKTASSEIQRLSFMVDKILNISLFESAAFQLNPEHFDFQSMLIRIVESQQLRKEKPVTMSLQYQVEKEIYADKTQIFQVMVNLIDNAIKYSGPQVHIAINCVSYAGGTEISLSDNGYGIPNEYHEYVFDKFFRVPNANSHAVKGYGLGLNYVKTIIEKHKGSIKVSNSADRGCKFTIKLPQKS